mgnify:FL=1
MRLIIGINLITQSYLDWMLEFAQAISPSRRQALRLHKQSSYVLQNKEALLSIVAHQTVSPSKFNLKPFQQKYTEGFNVCTSKDVFVFSKKQIVPNSKSKESSRKYWNSQEKARSN